MVGKEMCCRFRYGSGVDIAAELDLRTPRLLVNRSEKDSSQSMKPGFCDPRLGPFHLHKHIGLLHMKPHIRMHKPTMLDYCHNTDFDTDGLSIFVLDIAMCHQSGLKVVDPARRVVESYQDNK